MRVDGKTVSSIGRGICVLIGITQADTHREREWMVRKLLNLRLFEDESGAGWCKSTSDCGLEILCVSQFTLYGILKGNKPDFHNALTHEKSKVFYEQFIAELRHAYKPDLVKDGIFGADMQVHIQNDGPVTLMIEPSLPPAKERKPINPPKNKAKTSAATASGSAGGACAAATAPSIAPPGAESVASESQTAEGSVEYEAAAADPLAAGVEKL